MLNIEFRFHAADDPSNTDDEYVVWLDGKEANYSIQVCITGEYSINQYAGRDVPTEDWWMKGLATYRSLHDAKSYVYGLLALKPRQ